MKLKKITITCFVLILMSSCTESLVTVISATKKITNPGISTVKPYIFYAIKFDAKTSFNLKQVKINDADNVEVYQLLNHDKKANVNTDAEIEKGTYTLSFKSSDVENIDTNNEVFIYAEKNNKTHKQKVPIVKKEATYGR